MAMIDEVRSFFRALEFSVEDKDRNFVIAERSGLGGERDRRCIWLLTREVRQGRQMASLEDEYLGRFRGIAEKYRGAHLHLLVDSTEGFSQDFRTRASRDFGVRVQVPSWFFDMPFKHEVSKGSVSAIGSLLAEARAYEGRRVPQAYVREDGTRGADLVPELAAEVDRFLQHREPHVWFVVAPAGYGKSILFATLFNRLYEKFQTRKREQQVYPRPIAMLPSHMREAAGQNVMGLIDAFLRTDVAAPTTRAVFDWMLDHRYALWMIDGLDEVITRDPGFLRYLEDRITAPDARPAMFISLRDSLFETNDDLRDFLSYYGSVATVLRLKPWDRTAQRVFVWLAVENRAPREGESDSGRVREVVRVLDDNPHAKELATTPFYADLLLRTLQGAGDRSVRGELELLDVAVTEMCRREYGKKILREDLLPLPAFREWIEELAAVSYQSGGVSVEDLHDLATLAAVLATRDLTDAEERELVEQIVMAPFLTRSETTGRVELTHELLADYLAALKFVREFQNRSPLFVTRLARRQWPADSMLFKVLASRLADGLERLTEVAQLEALPADGLRNIVQLVAMIPGGEGILRSGRIPLNGARLQDVRLRDLNLDDLSLRACDLSNVDFTGSSLRRARLEGAVLRNTRFGGVENGLADAVFGEVPHFESVIVDGGRRIENFKVFQEWVRKHAGIANADTGPCPSARQLLHLFGKFVHVDGQGRRDALDRRGIVRGRQVPGAREYEEFVDSALDFGYLEPGEFGRISRPSGAKYGELVTFVKSQGLSAGLRSLLDSLCRLPGCRHVASR